MAALPSLWNLAFFALAVALWANTWREHWANYVTPMDYVRCAELHNRILEIGWARPGKQLTIGDGSDGSDPTAAHVLQKHPSWFQHWGKRAEAMRPRLSPDLTAFLQRAWVAGEDHSFFFYVNDITSPSAMWAHEENMVTDPDDVDRYLTLYSSNLHASHPDGLVFDQKKNLAIMQMDLYDWSTTHNGRQKWHPLEVVLGQWLDMIEMGKVQTVAEGVSTRLESHDPWTEVGYSKRQLEETLEVWEQLLHAIEARIPGHMSSEKIETLIDDSMVYLEEAGVLPGFVPEFLTKARRPAFRRIAPGISLPDVESITRHQPFRHVELEFPYVRPEHSGKPTVQFPVLLFASSEGLAYSAPRATGYYGFDRTAPFPMPWDQVRSYPAGLYFTMTDQLGPGFEDGVKLVLPFGVGGRGWARTADGAKFGENLDDTYHSDAEIDGQDRYDSLFQLGYNPFVPRHEVRLVQVLRAWVKLVKSGEWKIGPDGVLDGMDKWRDADTRWHWKKYVVPMSW
ncbi:uncharacterized protein PG998_015116 [Apiospora kogelbergensis]|uniref:uncharacterized protein n=1 Tax=Apiospora kogelbergensis TaxID=1337665 RepID=UPI00312E5700